jgi:hypothetical protein
LSYCVEIGWDKKLLPELERIWDSYYDEFGNKIENFKIKTKMKKEHKEMIDKIENDFLKKVITITEVNGVTTMDVIGFNSFEILGLLRLYEQSQIVSIIRGNSKETSPNNS